MTGARLCLLDSKELCDHDDGLNPPLSKLEAADALILLLFDSNSNCFEFEVDADDPEKIEEALISARLSFLFRSNLDENFTCAAAAASSLLVGSSRMPSPIFFEALSSSATLFF